MGTFYPNSSAQIDVASTPYIQDQAMIHGNLMMYLNEPSSAASFSDIGPVTSISNCVEIPSMAVRNEMMFIPPTSDQLTMQAISDTVDGERNFNGLSLSLSTHLSNAAQPSSFQHFPNAGLSSVLTTHLSDKVDYGQYDFHGDGHSSLRFGAPNNLQYMVNPKGVGYNGYQYEHTSTITSIIKSKYLKAAQQLLDDIVNVQGALKMHQSAKDQYMGKVEDKPTESNEKPVLESKATESTSAPSQDLSANERQELQNKLDRLVAMLDEVDRRYKQYYHQMQVLVSSFDLIAGSGGSKPYTTLARKTISRNFRTLRDAISVHIQTIRKSLGEQDSGQGAVIPRLRHIDHQLRQQRSLQQFGMMRHAWRPQRGLPENAVTTLRAWLFEHFLNPYPKDSEKIMLARQTGLTRSQVANWFINARVRLWKPMIENMYKEEFAEADLNLKSSPENTPKAAGEKPDTAYPGPSHNESKPNIYHQTTETSQSTGRAAMMVNPHADDNKHRELMKLHEDHHTVTNNHGFYPHDQNSLIEFQVPELSNYGVDNQVTLALGLRRIDGDVEHLSDETTNLRPDASAVNAIGSGTTEYSYFPVNQQHNFGNSHLLNNFVA